MKHAGARYAELFRAYVLSANESALAAIAALGADLICAEVPIEEIGGFQEQALLSLDCESIGAPWAVLIQRSSACLTELMIAYSLTCLERNELLNHQRERQREWEREKERMGRIESERQKMEIIGRMAGGVAHEINNLLQPVAGMAELGLADAPEECGLRENFTVMQDCARQAALIVKGLLTYVRQQTPKAHPIALGKVIERHFSTVQATLLPGCTIAKSIADKTSLVMGDEGEIVQILLNLVRNASYAMNGKGTIFLSLTLSEDKHLVLTVEDTGYGMSAEVAAHAFDPFYSTKPPGEGTGLGLAVVQGIVRDWGGSVTLKSRQGEGTSIVIALPVVEAKA